MPIRKAEAQDLTISATVVDGDLQFIDVEDGTKHADVLLLQYGASTSVTSVVVTIVLPPDWKVIDTTQNGHVWVKLTGTSQNKWRLSTQMVANPGRTVISYRYEDKSAKTSGAPVIIIERPPS